MRFCFCNQPVFGTDKKTGVGYCKSHQSMRSDFDRRSITQRAMAKQREKTKVRSLIQDERESGVLDSVKELTLDIDRVMSRYIRLRDMGIDHKIECFCCGKKVDWKKAHAMHFINRIHLATRFLLANVKSGCVTCNVEKRGNLEVYEQRLTPEIVNFLREQAAIVYSPSRSELKEILIDFQQKLKLVGTKLL